MKFTELGLDENILEALSYMGFEETTPIQEFAIPNILQGNDIIACAQTGTGKTAAFVLPILNKLIGKQDSNTNTLIIVPTRELAIQIDQQIQGFSYYISVGSIPIYGGGNGIIYAEQERALKDGRDIIVATPGRLISHLAQGYVNFKHVKHLILDEADKMLDMGFLDDIEKIIQHLPTERQTLLFSATMPPKIRALAKKIQNNPKEISLAVAKPAEGVSQKVFFTFDHQKLPALKYILQSYSETSNIIVFTSAKSKVNEIVTYLRQNKIKASGISSNLDQKQREDMLIAFRSKKINVLVATDVLSRGIDIKEISLVVNFDAPRDAEDYVHRIGRTARANSKGDACTLINPKDMARLNNIEKLIEIKIPRETLPEEFGETPEWNPTIENHKPKRIFSHPKKKNHSFRKSKNQKSNS